MLRHSRLKLVIHLVLVLCLAACGAAYAEDASAGEEPLKLTMAQAVEMALENNPTIILQTFAVKEAEYNVKVASINLKTTVTPQQLEDAEAALAAAQAQLQLTRQSQALAAREQYINVLKAQHTVELTGAAVAQANRNLSLVRDKAAVGLATENDLWEAENSLRRAEITLRTAQANLETQQIKFNQLLNRNLRAPFELIDEVQYDIPQWDLAADTAKALESRLDVAVAKRKLELAQRNLKVADPSYTPPAQIERLQMAVEKAQIELDTLITTVTLQVREAILALETANINVELANSALEQQRRMLQVAVLRHDSGFITTAELADAQAAANAAEVQAIQAMYEQALVVVRYLNTIGAAPLPPVEE